MSNDIYNAAKNELEGHKTRRWMMSKDYEPDSIFIRGATWQKEQEKFLTNRTVILWVSIVLFYFIMIAFNAGIQLATPEWLQ